MNELYSHDCPACSGKYPRNEAETGINFSAEVLTKALQSIYDGLNVEDDIQRDAFEEMLRIFNEAAVAGVLASKKTPPRMERFLEQLKYNNEVFSAFKVHRMQNDMAARMVDENGQLKPFDKWKRDIEDIADHYCNRWLQTEYDTAVLRAHQATDWLQFEDEKDVYPNVRWMPTTSPNPDQYHKQYWRVKLTLPIAHPFWKSHRPGDRWNCKCSLRQTDEPATTEAAADFKPIPSQPGLDNNPADDGKLFSDSHPYYTEAYPGAKKAAEKAVKQNKKNSFDYKKYIAEYDIAESVSIVPKKSEEETFEKILDQLNIRMKQFNIPKFHNIGKPSSSNAIASWDDHDNSLNLNLAKLSHPEKIWQKLEQYRKKGIKYDSTESVEDLVRNVIDHELGHKLMYQYNMKSDAIDTQVKAGKTVNGVNELQELGYYATTDVNEFFAEAFAAYMGPGRDKLGENIKGMIERMINKVKK